MAKLPEQQQFRALLGARQPAEDASQPQKPSPALERLSALEVLPTLPITEGSVKWEDVENSILDLIAQYVEIGATEPQRRQLIVKRQRSQILNRISQTFRYPTGYARQFLNDVGDGAHFFFLNEEDKMRYLSPNGVLFLLGHEFAKLEREKVFSLLGIQSFRLVQLAIIANLPETDFLQKKRQDTLRYLNEGVKYSPEVLEQKRATALQNLVRKPTKK